MKSFASNRIRIAILCLALVLKKSHYFVSGLTLTPATTPEEIIQSQLTALQEDDMVRVFDFASPANRERVGGDVNRFGEMVRSGPYKYLISHTKADILLYSQMGQSKQYLVRVIPSGLSGRSSIHEYWWSLSRVRTGPTAGCYMVDAVIPNA